MNVKATAEKFFAAYGAHDVEGMLALCADRAQGRYLPYGKTVSCRSVAALKKSGAAFRRPYQISRSTFRNDPS